MTKVTARAIVARNLEALIAHETPEGSRPSRRAWALTKGVDVRLIDRLCKGINAVTIDKLEEVATAAGLQPWQLLMEDFDPKDPPDKPVSEEDLQMVRKLRRLLRD